jgi:hypothetical protein
MVRRDGERYATYQPENHQWQDWLCDRDWLQAKQRRAGTARCNEGSMHLGRR